MKKIIAILTIVTGLGFALPAESSARDYCHNDRRIVSYLRCGTPVYSVYQVYGRDRYGHPVGRWINQTVSHNSCGVCNPQPSYRSSHHHGSSHYRPACPSPYQPSYHRTGGFYFSFGR